jgi:hypothetical protein
MEGSPPICRSLRNAELPRQPLWIACQDLAGVAFTGVGDHPAIARGAIRQKGYEFRIILVVRGTTGDHFVGQVGSVDGVYQSLRIGFCGLSEERHLVGLGDREVLNGTLVCRIVKIIAYYPPG